MYQGVYLKDYKHTLTGMHGQCQISLVRLCLQVEVPEEEMKRVFNMGIGYCVIVPPDVVDDTMILIDHPSQVIGHVRCPM